MSWDPIGVAGAVTGEYESYVPQVYRLVASGAGAEEIVAFLLQLERERIGLSGNQAKAQAPAESLLGWRAWLAEGRANPTPSPAKKA